MPIRFSVGLNSKTVTFEKLGDLTSAKDQQELATRVRDMSQSIREGALRHTIASEIDEQTALNANITFREKED